MRVRHKTERNEALYEVEEIGERYYIVRASGEASVVALSKEEYELVPETRWVRVYGALEHPDFEIAREGYRLVPVRVEGRDHALYYVERQVAC